MAISHVNTQTATEAAATSVTATKPTGTASGDLLLAFFSSNSQDATPPSGWTELTDQVTEVFRLQVFYKVAGGSEPSNYAFTVGATAPLVLSITALRGADTSSPFDSSVAVETALTHSEPYTTPSATTGAAGRLLYLRTVRLSGSTPTTFTASSVTELADVGVFSGGSVSYSQGLYLATSDYSTSGSKSGLAVTASSAESHNVVLTLGIKSSGIPGDLAATMPLPTMSFSGSWAIPAELDVELPQLDMSVEAFAGDNDATLDIQVPISVALSGNTDVRGPFDVSVPIEFEGSGETRRFAENVVELEREERWIIVTQDGYRPGLRSTTYTLFRVEMPLPSVSIDVFIPVDAQDVSPQATAYDPVATVGPLAEEVTATVEG